MKRAIVIGAGLLGAATAWNLGQRGWSVTVIEAGPVAGAASGASFGWINASFFHDEAHHRLRVAGIAAHRRLDPRFVGLTDWSGCVWHEEAGEGQALFAARLEALGYPVRRLTRAAMALHLPAVTDPCEALLFPDEGAVDPAALTRALIEGAGAEVWSGLEVLGIETVQGRASGVATAAGRIAADRVILTAGTGSPALLGRLGIGLPLLPRPGVLIRTRPVAPILRGVLCGPEGEARQLASGAVILPAAVSHQGDAAERLDELPGRLAEAALGRLGRRFAGLPLTADRIAIGWRPVPADGLPFLDEVLPGLCMAVMHSGVTLGPLAGEALANLVEGRDPGPHWAPYRLTRLSAPRPA